MGTLVFSIIFIPIL